MLISVEENILVVGENQLIWYQHVSLSWLLPDSLMLSVTHNFLFILINSIINLDIMIIILQNNLISPWS